MRTQTQEELRLCPSCDTEGDGKCGVCHGMGTIRTESGWRLLDPLRVRHESVNCFSCNNPGNKHKKGDGLCFFCKGKGFVSE